MRHELKTDPKPFAAVWDGTKLYEIRKDDRDRNPVAGFRVNDELLLRETRFSGEQMRGGRNLEYTGREVLCVVTHKLASTPALGLAPGWCILGIQRLELREKGMGRGAAAPTVPNIVVSGDVPVTGEVVGVGVKTRDPAFTQDEVGLGAVMSPRVPAWRVAQPPEHWVVKFGMAEAVARMYSTFPLYCMGTNCFSDGTTPHSSECAARHGATVGPVVDCEQMSHAEIRSLLTKRPFSHYFRPCPYDGVDVYRILSIFEVVHPAIQHAIKKLLVAGKRGAKDTRKDWSEAVVSINRAIEMMDEDKMD